MLERWAAWLVAARSAPFLPLPGDAVLVRALFEIYADGRDFDRDALIDDVTYNFDEFGYFGLSLWLAADPWPLDRLLAEKTKKASRVALYSASALTEHGLILVASGREPHYDATDGHLIAGDSGSLRVTAGSRGAHRCLPRHALR